MIKVLVLFAVLEVTCASLESSKSTAKTEAKREKAASDVRYSFGKNDVEVTERSSWRRELVLDDQEAVGDETKPTFRPFSQDELNHYLKKYTESQHNPKDIDSPNRLLSELPEDTSKSWHLVHTPSQNHPYDDRKGWVTLEPVAWSQGKVQKWEPNIAPKPHWDREEPPLKRPERPYVKPTYKPSKPSHWDSEPQYTYGKPSWQSWNLNSEIITDNRPSHFPEPAGPYGKPWYENRPHTEVVYHNGQGEGRPSGHPGDGDGRWVLISSTKGYSYPNRKGGYLRSLNVTPQITMSSHRTVRLTVLPALNDTSKTTTSHGGLLEVESTSQTVDESQREHAAKMLRFEKLEQPRSTPKPRQRPNRRSSTHFTIVPVSSKSDEAKKKALLAAVGAGMVPATVAMLLPALAGRRKRSLASNSSLPIRTFNSAIYIK